MSEHLPECGYGIELSFDGVIQPAEPCICDRLRACEQRIRQAIVEQLRAEFPKPTLGVQKAIRMVEGP